MSWINVFDYEPLDNLVSSKEFSEPYRNMEYCINECKSLAEQMNVTVVNNG